jgi:hypothetical protein
MFHKLLSCLVLCGFVASQLAAIAAHAHTTAVAGRGHDTRPHVHLQAGEHAHGHSHSGHGHSCSGHSHDFVAPTQIDSTSPSPSVSSDSQSESCYGCSGHDGDAVYLLIEPTSAPRSSGNHLLITLAGHSAGCPSVDRPFAEPRPASALLAHSSLEPACGKLFLKLQQLRI